MGWQFHKGTIEVVSCENEHEFNVQYWEQDTCKEDLSEACGFWKTFRSDKFCGSSAGGYHRIDIDIDIIYNRIFRNQLEAIL